MIDFKIEKLEEMIEESIPKIKENEGNFCISTSIPHNWSIEEEEYWDLDLEYECIKGRINKIVVEKIKKETGKGYMAENANFRIKYDLKNESYFITREPLFIFGRYEKYSGGISQTRWVCRNCSGKGCRECKESGKNYLSIEEVMGEEFKKEFKCKNYFLHASGREDVDVCNLAGRPFVLELVEPEKLNVNLEKIRENILKTGIIAVRNLKIVPRGFVEIVSNSHFDKIYLAEVETNSKISQTDIKKVLKELDGRIIFQKTPNRVIHRRANLTRKRKILDLKIGKIRETGFEIEIKTEPGTYIKELIHGDLERTKPSIAKILGMDAECKKLIVSKIEDEFLESIDQPELKI
ncbi:MAG: tRNA pseudouridine(54/55) synthase Pus10 [Candidatus Micrarchaeia archaeon]